MSFIRDKKDSFHLNKGRMYFDGLRQRAEMVKNIPDTGHKLGLNYNIVTVLSRLEKIRKLFTNEKITLKPLMKGIHESDVVFAIQEKLITLEEVSNEIKSLQDFLIEKMYKCLVHLETLPIMDKTEFEKSDNLEYVQDIFVSTLNNHALDCCLENISLLPESKDKAELIEYTHMLKKKITDFVEKQKLKTQGEDSDWTDDEFESTDDEFSEFKESDTQQDSEIKPHSLAVELKKENSEILPLVPDQKPIEDQPKDEVIAQEPPVTLQGYSIWCKVGTLLLTTASGIGIGFLIGGFTGGWGIPIGMVVGAVIGFIAGLQLIRAKDSCCCSKKAEVEVRSRKTTPAPIKFFPEYGKLNEKEQIRSVEDSLGLMKSI